MSTAKMEASKSDDEAGSALFEEGEKVLAYHGPMIYGAKVQKVELKPEGWRFNIHYLGWSKKWDEWVDSKRLLKENKENIAKKDALFKEAAADKKKSKAANANATAGGAASLEEKEKGKEVKAEKETLKSSAEKGKKRKAESSPQDSKPTKEKLVKIPLPNAMKKQLVDDWRSITEEGRLVKLPRSPTVAEMLQKYLEFKSKENGLDENAYEVSSGVQAYFDKALPAILLYKQERQQFSDMFPEGCEKKPSEVYGAEHLLRLFVKLPELLSYIQMEQDTLQLLVQKLIELLKFLQKNQSTFFTLPYDGPKVDVKAKAGSSRKADVKKEKK